MDSKVHRGFWRYMLPVPVTLLEKRIEKGKQRIETELAFMTDEHRLVHHFIVHQLPFHERPMDPGFIAVELDIDQERLTAILRELEEHMTFLYRNEEGAVVWAYPVTVEQTPHQVTFSTGEKIYAA